jgi:ABC-type nitrate/sulfonate/bicarbonate transport system permease component
LDVAGTLATQRELLAGDALRTARRVVTGYGAAVIVGVPLAAFAALAPRLGTQLDALVSLLRAVPPFAWTPLLLLWLGVGDTSAGVVVFLAAVFPIFRMTRAGTAAVPATLVQAAANLGASPLVVTVRVRIPGALPLTFVGLRLGWTLAWMSVVAAELVGADGGLGQRILDARNLARPDVALAGMVIIGALAASSESALALAERRLLRWRP